MKRFRVLWRQNALEQLAEIWLAAQDRDDINAAVEAIDKLLSTDPSSDLTSPLAEGLRTAIALPLRVVYSVAEADCIVDVATVRRLS